MVESDSEPGKPDEVSPEAAEQARIEGEYRRISATIMRTQGRRAWLVPLLAVPLAQLATEPSVPAAFLPYDETDLAEVRTAAERVRALLDRLEADPGASLTDDEAYALVRLVVDHRELINCLFAFEEALREYLGLPIDLRGAGLVRRLSLAVLDREEPPAVLAVLVSALLSVDPEDPKERDIVPLPDPRYEAVTRALDQRCFRLGFRRWEDALHHAMATWTAETWRGLLMAMSFGTSTQMSRIVVAAAEAAEEASARPALPPPTPAGSNRGRQRAGSRTTEVDARLAELERERDAARADAAAARLREAELTGARDRAQARVTALDERVAALERELQAERGMKRALAADLRRLRGEPEPEVSPDVPPVPLPEDLLRGRPVYLFTGQARAGAREEMAESLRAIGADDIRVFHVDEGPPGPDVFPPGAVVVVDTRFAGHKHTGDLKARVRRSPDAAYLAVQGGEGGLAARVAERLRQT